jgi:hypothetical protein
LENNSSNIDQDNTLPIIRNIQWLFNLIFRNWLLFLIVGVTAGIGGIIYAAYQKPEYKSHLTFALDEGDNGSGMGNILNLASQFGFSIGSEKDIFSGDNILTIMKSRRMVEKVFLSVDTFDGKRTTLIEYFLEQSRQRKSNAIKKIRFNVGEERSSFSYQQDSLLYKTYLRFSDNNIIAERPDRKLSIYQVSVTSHDEKFTKDFTDRLVAETNNFYTEIRTKKARETLTILQGRMDTMKQNLNSSIRKRATVQDVNINPAFTEAEVPVQKQQTNIQVYGAAYAEMFKNLELARFQYLNEIPLMQIIDGANYPMEKIKPGKLKTAILFALITVMLTMFVLFFLKAVKKDN